MKRKETKVLKLNGLEVKVLGQSVTINDKMSNCTQVEATKICTYLFEEGFLKKGEVNCEIVQQ